MSLSRELTNRNKNPPVTGDFFGVLVKGGKHVLLFVQMLVYYLGTLLLVSHGHDFMAGVGVEQVNCWVGG